jgi:hypothetical protein
MTITITWVSFLHWAWLIGEPLGCIAIGVFIGFVLATASMMSGFGRALGW